MIDLHATLNPSLVIHRMRKLAKKTPAIYAQELNKQLRASKGGTGKSRTIPVLGMTRRIAQRTGIKPQKRVARRIRFPRAGFAKPTKLNAGGLTLFEAYPMRYFPKGVSGGARVIPNEVDKHGRTLFGAPFSVRLRSGAVGSMRRLRPQKWYGPRPAQNPKTGYLPIGWSEYVDVTPIAYRARAQVLTALARAWPKQFRARMSREIRRIFGA